MRKTWKRALSYVLSAAMVLTAGVFAPADKTAKAADSEPKFTAELWSFGTFAGWASDPSATVEVDGTKEYTITADATEDLDDLFTSDNGTAVVLGNYADLTAAGLGTTYQVVGKSIKVNDGEDIPWVTEPVEWDAQARLVINNAWNPELDFATSVKQPIKAGDKISVTFEVKAGGSSTTPSDPTTAPTDPVTPTDKWCTASINSWGTIWGWETTPATPGAWSVDIDHYGDYTVEAEATNDCDSTDAALTVSIGTAAPSNFTIVGKTFKVNDKTYNLDKAKLYLDGEDYRISVWNSYNTKDAEANPISEEIEVNAGDKIAISFSVVETHPLFTAHLASFGTIWGWTGDDYGKPATPGAWQIDVTGAGDYTVSGEATNDCDSSGGVLAVLTTLKEVPTDYAIVGKTVKVNDKEYDWSKAAAYLDGDGYVRISVWNEWGDEKDGNPVGQDIEINAGDKVEATFSVVEPQKPDDPVDPQPPAVTKKVLGTAQGKTFTAGNFKYKVTTAATIEGTKKTAGKVTVVGLSSAGKKKTSINVKNTVSVKSTGASYKVTAIGSKAFKNASKLKSATLGTNIKSIPASAFAGCKKLSKLSVKKTLSSVKKNAFKGCKKTIKVTGGSKKVNKANVKKLKKSGYKKFK